MKLPKPSLKSQNYNDKNEVAPKLLELLVTPILENLFASYLYAVLGCHHIWLLPPPPPHFISTESDSGLSSQRSSCLVERQEVVSVLGFGSSRFLFLGPTLSP